MKENKGKLTCTLYCFTHMHTHAHRYAYLHTHTGEQCIYHSRAHVHVNMHAYTHLPIPYMHILTIRKLFPGITLTILRLPVTYTEIHPRTRTQAPHVRTNHMRIHITNSHTLTSPPLPFLLRSLFPSTQGGSAADGWRHGERGRAHFLHCPGLCAQQQHHPHLCRPPGQKILPYGFQQERGHVRSHWLRRPEWIYPDEGYPFGDRGLVFRSLVCRPGNV